MKKDGKAVPGGRGVRGSDRRLGFSEKDRGNIWKNHMEKIMNEENDWDQMTEVDVVEEPVEGVTREEIITVMEKMKKRKSSWTLRYMHRDDIGKWRDRD